MSFLYVTRSIAPALTVIALLNTDSPLVATALISTAIVHFLLFSETLLSRITRDIGTSNEEVFILRAPKSVVIWFLFTWSIVWAIFIESFHLFATDLVILGVLSVLVALVISALFIPSQLRIFLRRIVVVPHGIVASDPITLTDVVLLPLSKISSVELINKLDPSESVPDTTFAAMSSLKNVLSINLTEQTDSLIVRNSVNETERKSVDRIYFSVADPKKFVSNFHKRFHKIEPEELSRSQEIVVEKELGISTAPRSDAPLPAHRKKKKSK